LQTGIFQCQQWVTVSDLHFDIFWKADKLEYVSSFVFFLHSHNIWNKYKNRFFWRFIYYFFSDAVESFLVTYPKRELFRAAVKNTVLWSTQVNAKNNRVLVEVALNTGKYDKELAQYLNPLDSMELSAILQSIYSGHSVSDIKTAWIQQQ